MLYFIYFKIFLSITNYTKFSVTTIITANYVFAINTELRSAKDEKLRTKSYK